MVSSVLSFPCWSLQDLLDWLCFIWNVLPPLAFPLIEHLLWVLPTKPMAGKVCAEASRVAYHHPQSSPCAKAWHPSGCSVTKPGQWGAGLWLGNWSKARSRGREDVMLGTVLWSWDQKPPSSPVSSFLLRLYWSTLLWYWSRKLLSSLENSYLTALLWLTQYFLLFVSFLFYWACTSLSIGEIALPYLGRMTILFNLTNCSMK